MRKRELEMELQKVRGFDSPDVALEQYMTPATIAADILFEAYRHGDIEGLKVLDLGCGTGMLSIGSWLLYAGMVVGYDRSDKALAVAEENAESFGADISFMGSDVKDVFEGADTVVMNPPFGCQNAHADRPFLEKALSLSECVYSIHMADTLGFVESFAEKRGRNVDWHRTYEYDIPHMFDFHTRSKRAVEIVAVRILRRERAPRPRPRSHLRRAPPSGSAPRSSHDRCWSAISDRPPPAHRSSSAWWSCGTRPDRCPSWGRNRVRGRRGGSPSYGGPPKASGRMAWNRKARARLLMEPPGADTPDVRRSADSPDEYEKKDPRTV